MVLVFPLILTDSAGVQVTPAKVFGNISFTNTSADVVGYVTNHTVVSSPGTGVLNPVRLYVPGENIAVAAAPYTPVNTAPDALTYTAATFEIYPDVSSGSTNLLLGIDSVYFNNGASYRFGSVNLASPSTVNCSNITPVATNPGGTMCNIGECAARIDASIQFSGTPADLNAIDTSLPVSCIARVFVEEAPGSGVYAFQASSGLQSFALSQLLSGTAQLSFLLRQTSSPVRLELGCSVKIKPNETGFVIDPDTGLTPVGATHNLSAAGCGQTLSPSINVPVERRAGTLTGYFDVSGYTESSARVCIGRWPFISGSLGEHPLQSGCIDAPTVAATSLPSQQWIFPGIVEGNHAVYARARADDGSWVLNFPYRAGANLPVTVQKGATTDLGANFVSRPVRARGQVRLFDPGGLTDLKFFMNHPLLMFSGCLDPYTSCAYVVDVSYVMASGDLRVATASNGGSGFGASSAGRLFGSYSPTQHVAHLNYELLMNGLSPVTGTLDGSQAKPTPWTIDKINIYMSSGTIRQSIDIEPMQNLSYTADLSQYHVSGPIEVPEQRICFGKETIDFHIDPTVGSIRNPNAWFRSVGLYLPSNSTTTPYGGVLGASEPSSTSSSGASTTSISATLPEGYGYAARPSLDFLPVGSTSHTRISLNPITVPESGVVGCGTAGSTCVDIADSSGTSNQISVNITDATGLSSPDYCHANDNLDLNIRVPSSDVNVARVAYVLDPSGDPASACSASTAQILCPSGCGPNPTYSISLSGLSVGQHILTACATSDTGCSSHRSYSFNVDTQTPLLRCADDFTVYLLPGQASVAASDPRIANNLNAHIVGSCGLPSSTVSDDRPTDFPVGQRVVTFTAAGLASCNTTVTVSTAERVISYISTDPLIGEQVVKKQSFLDNSVSSTVYSHPQPYHFEYNRAGTRMAIVPDNDVGAVRIFDTATGGLIGLFPVPGGYKLYDVDFHPTDTTKYALVGTKISDPNQHAIFIYRNATQLSQFYFPLSNPEIGLSRPQIGWSPDGANLSAAFTWPEESASDLYTDLADNQYMVIVAEWNVVNDQIVPPSLLFNYQIHPNLRNREDIREMVYQDGDWRAVATDLKITRAIFRPRAPYWFMGPILGAINSDIDLTPDGKAAAYLYSFRHGAFGRFGAIYSASNLDGDTPSVLSGPVIQHAKSVAISSDARYLAVGTNDKVILYDLPGFTVITEFDAVSPKNIEFKPLAP